MQVLTAKEAKTNFGSLLDTVQREPVLITRNSRPTGVFVSIEDIQGTYLAELFEQKQEGYDAWLQAKVNQSVKNFEKNPTKGNKTLEEVHDGIMAKLKAKLEK